ncbi:unnamed protein product [Prunus armeniaca]|uniref:Uncharacterized protein n=1 Tax=Prunus armeniaca TaxID=36596 RepID=A0A6J5YCR7_PRUAR|nr:unnamed protein product [Prunus armeniaca]CAB4321645.1 unnamed protein product [Prunus armeniaca]
MSTFGKPRSGQTPLFPRIFGHEAAEFVVAFTVVESVGDSVKNLTSPGIMCFQFSQVSVGIACIASLRKAICATC